MVDEQGATKPCTTPVAELRPITLRELRPHVGRFVPGKVVRLTTIMEPAQLSGVAFPAVDEEGTAIVVGVYNQTGGRVLSQAQLRRLYPEGSKILVKNPYVKVGMSGDPMLRVDHPANVVVEGKQGGDGETAGQQQAAGETAEAYKKRGNDAFARGDTRAPWSSTTRRSAAAATMCPRR